MVALVASISKLSRASLKSYLAKIDLEEGQDAFLLYFSDYTSIQMMDIAKALGVSPTTVSKMVVVLERKGLIERLRPKKDRRQAFIKLTDAGIAAQQRVHIAHEAFAIALRNDLGPDINAIANDLDRINQAIAGLSARYHSQRQGTRLHPLIFGRFKSLKDKG